MLSRAVAGCWTDVRRVAAGQHARGRSGDAEAAAPPCSGTRCSSARLSPCACGSDSSPRCGSDSVRARSAVRARNHRWRAVGLAGRAQPAIGAVGIRIAVNERYVEPDHELATATRWRSFRR
jgi:hypothetical protein